MKLPNQNVQKGRAGGQEASVEALDESRDRGNDVRNQYDSLSHDERSMNDHIDLENMDDDLEQVLEESKRERPPRQAADTQAILA